ncbi:MAG: Tetratricopeptide repeat, partial [Bacteroidota bacterium]
MQTDNKPLLIFLLILLGSPVLGQTPRNQLKNANILYEGKAYSQAIESYKKILAQHPAEEEAYAKIADCYASLNRMEEAANAYKKLFQIQKG